MSAACPPNAAGGALPMQECALRILILANIMAIRTGLRRVYLMVGDAHDYFKANMNTFPPLTVHFDLVWWYNNESAKYAKRPGVVISDKPINRANIVKLGFAALEPDEKGTRELLGFPAACAVTAQPRFDVQLLASSPDFDGVVVCMNFMCDDIGAIEEWRAASVTKIQQMADELKMSFKVDVREQIWPEYKWRTKEGQAIVSDAYNKVAFAPEAEKVSKKLRLWYHAQEYQIAFSEWSRSWRNRANRNLRLSVSRIDGKDNGCFVQGIVPIDGDEATYLENFMCPSRGGYRAFSLFFQILRFLGKMRVELVDASVDPDTHMPTRFRFALQCSADERHWNAGQAAPESIYRVLGQKLQAEGIVSKIVVSDNHYSARAREIFEAMTDDNKQALCESMFVEGLWDETTQKTQAFQSMSVADRRFLTDTNTEHTKWTFTLAPL